MITVDNQPTINSDSHLQTKPSFPNLAASGLFDNINDVVI